MVIQKKIMKDCEIFEAYCENFYYDEHLKKFNDLTMYNNKRIEHENNIFKFTPNNYLDISISKTLTNISKEDIFISEKIIIIKRDSNLYIYINPKNKYYNIFKNIKQSDKLNFNNIKIECLKDIFINIKYNIHYVSSIKMNIYKSIDDMHNESINNNRKLCKIL